MELVPSSAGIPRLERPATTLRRSGTAPDEMQDITGAYLKCEKPKQPKNNQNQGE
jgi:hypothetical protein